MELIGNLKKQVESAKNRDDVKSMIEEAGMKLTDDELNKVAGGASISSGESSSQPHHHLGAPGIEPHWDALSKEEKEEARKYKIVF